MLFNSSLSIYAMISLGSSVPVFEKAELEAPLCTLLGDASLGLTVSVCSVDFVGGDFL